VVIKQESMREDSCGDRAREREGGEGGQATSMEDM
jgi:hypothetical protein